MFMNRFFSFCAIATILAGCGGGGGMTRTSDWGNEYGNDIAGTPASMQYGNFSATDGDTHRVAVLLPLSGQNASTGKTIRTSVEMAVLQSAPQNLSVTFFDTARTDAFENAVSENPAVIIGPVFAGEARMLNTVKSADTPALSFTSDATAIGDGIMTMNLMPTNSVEAIAKEMSSDNVTKFVILAPDTESGRLMAGTAKNAASIYGIKLVGIIYYTPGNSESIKNASMRASMNAARTAANTRAREILSDILTKERLTAIEKSSLSMQLDKISKSDTLGAVPYDAVLFLGTGDDSMALASFLRYYNVSARDARFYGTAMWDGSNITSDFTMSGAKYAALPEINENFANLYTQVSGTAPSHLAAFGYDAANMAMGMIYSDKSDAAYLLDPSGYIGASGLVRLRPNGDSQRALRILELDASGTPRTVRAAPQNFMTPIYNIEQRHIIPASEMALETDGINPMNYIRIPERLNGKYKSKTFGANMTRTTTVTPPVENITVLPEDDSDPIENPDFQPTALESIDRTYIDSVEIEE